MLLLASSAKKFKPVRLPTGTENSPRLRLVHFSGPPLNLVAKRRFEPASPSHQCAVTVRDLSNLYGWYALFAYQLCTSHDQKFLQSSTSDRGGR
jgi:hypothetical protein